MAPSRPSRRFVTLSDSPPRLVELWRQRSLTRHCAAARTDQDDDEAVLVVHHLSDHAEQPLHELAALREPLREERVRVDLDELAVCIPTARCEPEQRCLASKLRTARTAGSPASVPGLGTASSCRCPAARAAAPVWQRLVQHCALSIHRSAHLFHATTFRSTFASEKRSVVAM